MLFRLVKKGKERAVTEEKSIKITATKFLRINQYSSKIVEQESAGVKKLDIKLKWEMLKKPAIEKYSIEYGDVKIEFIPKSINIVEDFITNYIEYDSLRDSNKESLSAANRNTPMRSSSYKKSNILLQIGRAHV